MQPNLQLVAKGVRFYSRGDEAAFFQWLDRLSCVDKYEGQGDALHIQVRRNAVDAAALRELLALFHRYGIDKKQLSSGAQGRFTSPDPIIVTSKRLENPQELNLYSYVANNPLRYIDPTGAILVATGDQQADYNDLCKIAGDSCKDRLKIDEKTGNVTFDTKDLDFSKNEGAKLLNDLITSKNTYEFSEGPTIATDKGPVKIDYILANLPAFADQRAVGQPRAGVADVVGFYFNNPKVTRGSNTKLGVAPNFTTVFHELAEAFEKIDNGKGNSYEAGHNAALDREKILRDQRPYLKEYNTGAGGPANSPNPEGKIIIKR